MGKLLFIITFISFTLNAYCQKCYYEGGFFEKKGQLWYEYKDAAPTKAVNWFTEIFEDDNFYVGDNGNCKIAIPKSSKNNFLLMHKNSDKWVFKYKSKTVNKAQVQKLVQHSCFGKITKASVSPRNNGIVVSVNFDVNGLSRETGLVSVYLYTKNGKKVNSGFSTYKTSDNQFAYSKKYASNCDNMSYTNFELYIPYIEMHKAKIPSTGTYKYKVIVWAQGKEIASCYTQEFCFYDISYDCVACATRGVCSQCNGTGWFMGRVFCYSCGGSGRCKLCEGTGVILTCNIGVPGRMISMPQMKRMPSNDSHSTSNFDDVRIYQETCTFCKGSGVNPLCDFPPKYTNEVVTLFYCEYCKKTMEYHTHASCPSCQGKGFVQRVK